MVRASWSFWSSAALVSALAWLVLAPGAHAEDTPPILQGGTVAPASLDFNGGQVTITVNAIDDVEVTMAEADVFTGSFRTAASLIRSGETSFSGQVDVPSNATAEPIIYSVAATVSDGNGGTDTKPIGEIRVGARPAPGPGRLQISPAWVTFGPAAVGQATTRAVTLRNAGPAGSAPVTGMVSVPSAPFGLLGDGGAPFRLNPGESKMVRLEFRPRRPGLQSRTLVVRRTDGQRDTSVRLVGLATRR